MENFILDGVNWGIIYVTEAGPQLTRYGSVTMALTRSDHNVNAPMRRSNMPPATNQPCWRS